MSVAIITNKKDDKQQFGVISVWPPAIFDRVPPQDLHVVTLDDLTDSSERDRLRQQFASSGEVKYILLAGASRHTCGRKWLNES